MINIQQEIDDAEACGGGIVNVPTGDYRSQGRLFIPSGVELVGSGIGTTIAPVATRPAANSPDGRRYYIRLEGFGIAGDGGEDALGYIGIDFRETSVSLIKRCYVANVKTGILLAGAAYYNTLDQLTPHASVDGIELYNGANQNTILNCMCGSPIGINIFCTNGTVILGGSGEGATPGNFIKQNDADCVGTCVKGFRGEVLSPTPWGPVWCNTDNLIGSF